MHDTRLPATVPLVVDLDGTLIHSDLLWEAIVLFISRRFLRIWILPLWLFLGKAGFKAKLAAAVTIDPAALPYDRVLLAEIAVQRALGRCIVLATAAQQGHALQIAAHLQLFDLVLASDEVLNLAAGNKARRLVALYGEKGFDYIGDASADVPVWQCSRGAFSVARIPFRLPDGRHTQLAGSRRARWAGTLLKTMRPRQWLKNLLVFVPMLAGHALSRANLLQALLAFAAFSLCASSAYLLNDALDAQNDRLHASKHTRPIAAGTLPLPVAMLASPLLALLGLALCARDSRLLSVVAVYLGSTLCYSLWLKRMLMVDIVALALLYTLRIIGGAASTHTAPSFWLLAFSFFIFLSLATLKRHSELATLQERGEEHSRGRAYTTLDRAPLGILGINCGLLSILVFMLYFNSDNVLVLYRSPIYLLGIVPLLALWQGRLWTLSFRGLVHEDPILYVSKDPFSLAIIGACAALTLAASF
ncbi:UbiA family prenyltransferase [Janthinobacterium sp.]|uniref:UbiA family prenyltransferase n=1 Tax=Janthinobacterium sp. TaxID=1871054 RepID=UPI00293D651F|nr:UbiA family prenyltransferase [Janthinobacterium sp.]